VKTSPTTPTLSEQMGLDRHPWPLTLDPYLIFLSPGETLAEIVGPISLRFYIKSVVKDVISLLWQGGLVKVMQQNDSRRRPPITFSCCAAQWLSFRQL